MAVAESVGPTAALTILDAIPKDRIAGHQPFWVARAHMLELGGDPISAIHAYERAIGLTEDAASRRFLASRKTKISG